MLKSITIKAGKRGFHQQGLAFSSLHETIHGHNATSAAIPLIEHHRPRWPRLPIPKPAKQDEFEGIMGIPPTRTVPASALRFQIQATFSHGTSLFYEHMPCNPIDFRVRLHVYVADLNLSEDERHIFIRMVGLRYNTGKKEVKLTAERFPNRIENKRYLTYLLECLVVETKKLAIMQRDGTFPEVLPTILVPDSLI